MKPMTPDFFAAQLRLVAVAVIAYLSGKEVFTPADATLATAILGGLGPILVPWAFSIYSNWGTVKVNTDSKAAAVAQVEKVTDSKDAAVAAVMATPEKAA